MRRWSLYSSLALVMASIIPLAVSITTRPLKLPMNYSVQIWESTVVVVHTGHPSTAIPLAFICWALSLFLLMLYIVRSAFRKDRGRGFDVKNPQDRR